MTSKASTYSCVVGTCPSLPETAFCWKPRLPVPRLYAWTFAELAAAGGKSWLAAPMLNPAPAPSSGSQSGGRIRVRIAEFGNENETVPVDRRRPESRRAVLNRSGQPSQVFLHVQKRAAESGRRREERSVNHRRPSGESHGLVRGTLATRVGERPARKVGLFRGCEAGQIREYCTRGVRVPEPRKEAGWRGTLVRVSAYLQTALTAPRVVRQPRRH